MFSYVVDHVVVIVVIRTVRSYRCFVVYDRSMSMAAVYRVDV